MSRFLLWSFLLFVGSMGFYLPRAPFTHSAQWSDLVLAVCAATALLQIIRGRLTLDLRSRPLLCALFLATWTLVSTLVNGSTWPLALGTFELAAIYWLATQAAREPHARNQVLRVWAVSAVVMGALGFLGIALDHVGLQTSLASNPGAFATRLRIHGPCITANMLASLCLVPWLALVAPTGRQLFSPRVRRQLLLALSLTLIFTLSRTLLAAALGALIFRKRNSKVWLAGGVTVLLALVFLSVRFHFTSAELGFAPSLSKGLRWIVLGQAWHNAAAHPLFGMGPDSLAATLSGFPTADSPTTGWNAHCTPLAIVITLGLPALAAFGALIALALRRALVPRQAVAEREDAIASADRSSFNELQLVLVTGCLTMIFDSLTTDLQHARHFWLLLGLL